MHPCISHTFFFIIIVITSKFETAWCWKRFPIVQHKTWGRFCSRSVCTFVTAAQKNFVARWPFGKGFWSVILRLGETGKERRSGPWFHVGPTSLSFHLKIGEVKRDIITRNIHGWWMIYMSDEWWMTIYKWWIMNYIKDELWMTLMNDPYEWPLWMPLMNDPNEWPLWMAFMNDPYYPPGGADHALRRSKLQLFRPLCCMVGRCNPETTRESGIFESI